MIPITSFTLWLFQYGLHHSAAPVPAFARRAQKIMSWPIDAKSWEDLEAWMDKAKVNSEFRWCMNLAWLDYEAWMKLNKIPMEDDNADNMDSN